jgi:ATP-binding cassette subfamily B (MDR/TAP) protein 1
VLNKATFFFPSGEITFIVGKSGSGKSTVGNLLMKYYKPTSGDILIDGHPIQTLDAEWHRQNVTLVQQQSALFNETVYQNIAFGREGQATMADVLNASKTGDLQQTITDLPDGLSTLVGSNREPLSGGQQQRIAIARARLRDAPILILDEATCALDQTSKRKAMEEIRKWRAKKTTIVITHDASQIHDDEYVYVLDHGNLVQEGYRRDFAEKGHGALFLSIPFMLEVMRQFSNRDENQS